MSRTVSELERARASYQPRVPRILEQDVGAVGIAEGLPSGAVRDADEVRRKFPETFGRPALSLAAGSGPPRRRSLNVGVVLSGGQAPGGHNVITGLFDALQSIHAESRLYGFIGGPGGIFEERYELLTRERIDPYRNTGGFDLIGSGRDKIETGPQLEACVAVCARLALDGLVVVGGDDSNTNAAVLAEFFVARGVDTAVIGVPKTIDGDLKGDPVEISFGFDTATKVYSELVGNICRDAKSARKYWHFVKLMGRSASHVTLECALATQANIALIGEEIDENATTLQQVVERIADVVEQRAAAGKHYGVCLIPEGLIEFIPEMRGLIGELNDVVSSDAFETLSSFADKRALVERQLSPDGSAVFIGLPERIQRQLLLGRDSHGNVPVSQIDTEQLVLQKVAALLEERGGAANKFKVQSHFFGYEGRCAAPSNFDADYTYGLGRLAATLIAFERTGYLCAITHLAEPPERREAMGVPLTSMMQIEKRKGERTPVIAKALVDRDSPAFRLFAARRPDRELADDYLYPGPIQYFGPTEICDRVTRTLLLDHGGEES